MLTSGDVVDLDLRTPSGREADFHHPAVLVTAQRILDATPSVVHVVPLTSTLRPFHSEVVVDPDDGNGPGGDIRRPVPADPIRVVHEDPRRARQRRDRSCSVSLARRSASSSTSP